MSEQIGILGAGVGGLFTGAFLVQKGYHVTLIEQLPVCGGGLYSFERDGEWWNTGMHFFCGMESDGMLRRVLDEMNIVLPVEETTLDNDPSPLIGTDEWRHFAKGAFRTIGPSIQLAQALSNYITSHGGEMHVEERVTSIEVQEQHITSVITNKETYHFDIVVSSLHPKVLIQLCTAPIFRPIAVRRIEGTPESHGAFKVYIKLKPNTILHDTVTHYLPQEKLLVLTPPARVNEQYAPTIECVQASEYTSLTPWYEDRKKDYASYETFKNRQAQQVIDLIAQHLYPNIRESIASYFTSTALTFRDDFLTPEGAMYGLNTPVGAVITHTDNLFLTGQDCHLRGLFGTMMTSREVVRAIGK